MKIKEFLNKFIKILFKPIKISLKRQNKVKLYIIQLLNIIKNIIKILI